MGARTETRLFISCDREGCKHEIERGRDQNGDWNDRNWGSIQGGGRLADITFTLCDICANELVTWLNGAHFAPLSGSRPASSPVSGFSAAGTAALDQRDHALQFGSVDAAAPAAQTLGVQGGVDRTRKDGKDFTLAATSVRERFFGKPVSDWEQARARETEI